MEPTNNAQRYGATAEDWQQAVIAFGAENLLPTIHNPNAKLSPNSKMASAKGIAKIPSRYNSQHEAGGFKDWTNHKATAADVEHWSREPDYGICLKTGAGFVAIDVDSENEREQDIVRAVLTRHCGGLPSARYRDNSYRRTYVLAVAGARDKRVLVLRAKTDSTPSEQIEFLELGQQTIISGTHTSGARIKWTSGSITPPPVLNEDEYAELVEELRAAFPGAVWAGKAGKAKAGEYQPGNRTANADDSETVYTPFASPAEALAGDPVAAWLRDNNQILDDNGASMFFIRCPNEHNHSDGGSVSATAYTSDKNPELCAFDCKHAGCSHLVTPWHFAEAYGMPMVLRDAYKNRTNADALNDFDDLSVTAESAAAVLVEPQTGEADLFNWRGVDLATPPGLAGSITAEIRRLSYRVVDTGIVPAALHLLALAAGLGQKRGISGEKLSLCTFTIAPTSAGKESGQSFTKEVTASAGIGAHLAGKPRSDKDLIISLIDADASVLFSIDEAHSFLDSVKDAASSEHKKALGGLMLEMLTSSIFKVSPLHARELNAAYDAVEKTLKIENGKEEKAHEAGKLDALTLAVNQHRRAQAMETINKKRGWLRDGIRKPIANFMMSSTPENLERAINNADICSGLIGRSLIFYGENWRTKAQFRPRAMPQYDENTPEVSRIINGLKSIANREGTQQPWEIDADADEALETLFDYFEDDERLNAPIVGGLYARGCERIYGLAALLAVESQRVTFAHVRYATAVFMQSVETAQELARQNAATGITEVIQLEILAKLGKGKQPRATLIRTIERKAAVAPHVKRAADLHQESPVEIVLKALETRGTIEKTGRGAYQLKAK